MHCFPVSLDGCNAGPNQDLENPIGLAVWRSWHGSLPLALITKCPAEMEAPRESITTSWTWCSIYKRAFETLPELNLDIATGSIAQRGRQKKQLVLAYLRERREELRPISPSKLQL
jgi:hypothetical protein